MEEYSYIDKLSNEMQVHPKQSEIQKLCLQSLLIHGPKRWGLQILLPEVRSREIFRVLASLNCKMGMSLRRVDRGHKILQEYANKWSSSWTARWDIWLCFRWRSFRLRSSDDFLIMFRKASPAAFLPQIEVSSARSRDDASCSSTAVGSCHAGGPFFFCRCARWRGLGGTIGTRSSSSMAWSRLSSSGSFLVVGRTRVLSSSYSSSCMSRARYAGFSLWHGKNYMSLWVTRSSTRFSGRLIRKTRQAQHNMSHCGVLSWRKKTNQKLGM